MGLSQTQRDFMDCSEPYPAFVGGFGSGKTTAGMARALQLKIAHPKCDVAYYLPTYGLVRDIALERLPAMCEAHRWQHKVNKTTSIITFKGKGRLILRSMDNPAHIVGYQVAHSIVDELDTLPRDKARSAWNKIIARNRQNCLDAHGARVRNSVAVATTPEGFGFVYERWQQKPAPGYVLFRARTVDNAENLPPDYITDLTNSYPPNLLMAYLDGEFVNLTAGTVYHAYRRELNRCDTVIIEREPLHIGMDFNVTKMAAVVFVLRNNYPHAVAELTGVLDTPAMIELIAQRFRGHSICVYPDASGNSRHSVSASASDISLLKAARLNVFVNSRNPFVRDRVLAMNGMLERGGERRLRVNDAACPVFAEALEKQAYGKNGEPDKSAGLDHITDAGGYFIAYRFAVRPPSAGKVQFTGI